MSEERTCTGGCNSGWSSTGSCMNCGGKKPELPNYVKAFNQLYRLARNYEARTATRAHTELDVVINPRTLREVLSSPEHWHVAMGRAELNEPIQLFGYHVLQSYEVPEGEVRMALKLEHKLLDDLPHLPARFGV